MRMIVTFGEMLLRLEVPNPYRFSQTFPGPLYSTFAGAECNMAVGIAALGGKARLSTVLPAHDLGQSAVRFLRGWGVDTDSITLAPSGRLGTYYLEHGAGLRAGQVLYDRAGSTFSLAAESDYSWDAIFENAESFMISAISPAVSEQAAAISLKAVQEAKKRGIPVILDLNFRSKLWQWKPGVEVKTLAQQTMIPFLERADEVLTNLGQLNDVVNLNLPDCNDPTEAAAQLGTKLLLQKYPKIQRVLITLRESLSASHNRWGAFGFDASQSQACLSPLVAGQSAPYEIESIIDRVGVGDAFAAGYLRATQLPFTFQERLDYATAASALAHYVHGDFLFFSHEEVLSLMKGNRDGRIRR